MKRNIKKVADLTQKQYEAALARNGMLLDRNTSAEFDVVSEFGFQLMGKTRRAKLAHALYCKDEYDESQIRDESDYEATPITGAVDEAEATFEAEVADGVVKLHDVPSHEEEAAATDAARRAQDAPVDTDCTKAGSGNLAPKTEVKSASFTSFAVAEKYRTLSDERGAEVAGTLLQEAIKACGQKIYIDGKVGPYTVRLANRIPEADLLAALNSRAQIGKPHEEMTATEKVAEFERYDR